MEGMSASTSSSSITATTQNTSPPSADGVNKRKAAATAACVHCHRRKVRCDARVVGFPCTNCRSAGKTDCRIHEKKKRVAVRSVLDPVPIRCRPASASAVSPPSHTLPPPSTLPSIYPSNTRRERHVGGPPIANAPVSQSVGRDGNSHGGRVVSPNRQQPDQGSSTDPDSHSDLERRLVKLIDDDEESGRREIQPGVRAIYVGHDVSNMSFLIRQQREKDDGVYHFAANEIPRRQLRTGQDQLLMDAMTLPDQPLVDELVEAYFQHVNPGYPIVDEDLFMAQYRNRDPSDPPPILLLQAILLVGSHVARPKAERDALKEIFFRRTKYLFDSRMERNRDIVMQAALLLTWHSDSTDDDVLANAYHWVGVAARIATGLGMHRNPVSSRFSPRDRRMWRRLWYITLQFDVMGADYLASNLEDADVSDLTPADFEGCGPRVQIEFVINFTELCKMISYIVRERFGLRVSAERRKAVLQGADEALANWSLKLPDSLRLRASDMDPWSAMLHLTYNNLLILLHRPHPRASAYSDDYGPHDAEICSAAAGVIASIFEELRLNSRLNLLWFSGVHTLFTAMIQVRVELRFSNPVLAINALRRFDSTSHSLRELADYWEHAGTILRLFQNSKRLQEDLRMATSERPKQFSNTTTTANNTDSGAGSSGNQGRSDNVDVSNENMSGTDAARGSQNMPFEMHTPESQPLQPVPPPPQTMIDSQHPPTHHHQQYDNWAPGANPVTESKDQTYPTTPTVAAMMDQPREFLDWRQLFSFADPDQPVPMAMEGLPELEDEWRQIYWQDTPMSDLFYDGGWLHG